MLVAASSSGSGGGAGGVILLLFLILLGIVWYFLPTVIAKLRHMNNLGGIFIVNLLAGWTLVGWIIALVMACSQQPAPMAYPPMGYGYPPPGYGPPGSDAAAHAATCSRERAGPGRVRPAGPGPG